MIRPKRLENGYFIGFLTFFYKNIHKYTCQVNLYLYSIKFMHKNIFKIFLKKFEIVEKSGFFEV